MSELGAHTRLVVEAEEGTPAPSFGDEGTGIVGESLAIRTLRAEIARHAAHPFPVLISGETGTGKDLVARGLHDLGPRRARSYIAVNAAAIPRELATGELFGHVRGAFTGAIAHRRGLVQLADRGTLFLDEIAELDLATQGSLLRLVEEHEARAVGAEALRRVDVRIIAATHVDLRAAVGAGRFRIDLYHRLAAVRLHVPALRERMDDLALLARHLLVRLPREYQRDLHDSALDALRAHRWPGNVRELGHVLLRAALASEAIIHAKHIRAALRDPLEIPLICAERAVLGAALAGNRGSVSAAARTLGVPRSTLRDRLRRVGLSTPT